MYLWKNRLNEWTRERQRGLEAAAYLYEANVPGLQVQTGGWPLGSRSPCEDIYNGMDVV